MVVCYNYLLIVKVILVINNNLKWLKLINTKTMVGGTNLEKIDNYLYSFILL